MGSSGAPDAEVRQEIMQRYGIDEIMSFDTGFDHVSTIARARSRASVPDKATAALHFAHYAATANPMQV